MNIQFNKPFITGKEIKYIEQIFQKGNLGSDGEFTFLVQNKIKKMLGTKKVVMTTSCTHALEMAVILAGIKENDEVIVPTYTFTSTANAVLLQKAKPVFTEVNKEDLNIDVKKIEEKINSKTKAIIVVHYGGNACNMDEIMKLAKYYGLYVIEDTAQAFGSTYKGQALGTIGHFGCFSFHSTKNVVAGEGGALSINISDDKICNRADVIKNKGTNRTEFVNKKADFYQWVDIGSSYTPSEILMGCLYAQLQEFDNIHNKREKIFKKYLSILENIYIDDKINSYSRVNQYTKSNYHLFYILMKNKEERIKLTEYMKKSGIVVYTHFVPLHKSVMGKRLGYRADDFPFEKDLDERIVRLPIYPSLNDMEVEYITTKLKNYIHS